MTQSPPPSTTPVSRGRFNRTLSDIDRWLNGLSVAFFLSWLSGRLLGRFYFFELFSHFEIQYHWLAYGLLGLQLLYSLVYPKRNRSGWVLIPLVLVASVLYFKNTDWVPGDYDASPAQPPGDVRIFHANVLYTRTDYEPTLALIRAQQPNLYVLQEMTPRSIRLVTSRLNQEFPHWFACWSKGPCWTLVGSRTPIRVDQRLVQQQRLIDLTTQVGGRTMSLVTVHPRTPLLPSWFRERNGQLTLAAQKTRRNAQPTVLLGDFNISVFSPVYKAIFESPTQPAGALQTTRRTLTQPTWPTFFPFLMIPIDHAFVNGGFRPLSFQTLNHPGSDHRAVVVDLVFSH